MQADDLKHWPLGIWVFVTCDSGGDMLVEVEGSWLSPPIPIMSTTVWDQVFDAEHVGFNVSQAYA